MSFTYDVTKFNDTTPSTSYPPTTVGERYQVRLMIQDTNLTVVSKQLFQDEEVDFTISQSANVYMAGAALCNTLVARGGGMDVKSKKVGDLAITYDVEFYRRLAGTLEARGVGHQIPYAGGISVADKQAQSTDTDWTQPSFKRGLDENPAAPQPENPSNDPLTSI